MIGDFNARIGMSYHPVEQNVPNNQRNSPADSTLNPRGTVLLSTMQGNHF